MFCKSARDVLSKYLIPYAQMITDTPLDVVLQISWGSAVLSATYRGLCTTVLKGESGILIGCSLLL
jgi:hypothetical protein